MSKAVLRSVFDTMTARERMDHIKAGGTISDDPAPPPPPRPVLAANQMLREDFERMKPAGQMEWFKGGGKVVNRS